LFGTQQGALPGPNPRYHGRPSYHPLLAAVAEMGTVIGAELRPGDTGFGDDQADFVGRCIDRLHARDPSAIVCVRIDAAGDCAALMKAMATRDAYFFIKGKMERALCDRITLHPHWQTVDVDAHGHAHPGGGSSSSGTASSSGFSSSGSGGDDAGATPSSSAGGHRVLLRSERRRRHVHPERRGELRLGDQGGLRRGGRLPSGNLCCQLDACGPHSATCETSCPTGYFQVCRTDAECVTGASTSSHTCIVQLCSLSLGAPANVTVEACSYSDGTGYGPLPECTAE
jgi:hypothetical protein